MFVFRKLVSFRQYVCNLCERSCCFDDVLETCVQVCVVSTTRFSYIQVRIFSVVLPVDQVNACALWR